METSLYWWYRNQPAEGHVAEDGLFRQTKLWLFTDWGAAVDLNAYKKEDLSTIKPLRAHHCFLRYMLYYGHPEA